MMTVPKALKSKYKFVQPAFRAYKPKTEELIYCAEGALIKTTIAFAPEGRWSIHLHSDPKVILANYEECILMRGSGQPDSNGLEIYEGDIVQDLSTFPLGLGCGDYVTAAIIYKSGLFYEDYFKQPIYFYDNLEVVGDVFRDEYLLEES